MGNSNVRIQNSRSTWKFRLKLPLLLPLCTRESIWITCEFIRNHRLCARKYIVECVHIINSKHCGLVCYRLGCMGMAIHAGNLAHKYRKAARFTNLITFAVFLDSPTYIAYWPTWFSQQHRKCTQFSNTLMARPCKWHRRTFLSITTSDTGSPSNWYYTFARIPDNLCCRVSNPSTLRSDCYLHEASY